MRQPGLEPCGQCVACLDNPTAATADLDITTGRGCRCERKHPELAWLRDVTADAAGVKTVADAAKDAIAEDDTESADRLLAHAVHLGHTPSSLLAAGGKRRRKPDPPPEPAEMGVWPTNESTGDG